MFNHKFIRRLRSIAVPGLFAVAASAGLVARPCIAHAEVPPPSNLFVIGAFYQPTYDFAAWQARGVNTMVDFNPAAQSQQVWESAVIADGLYEIRAASANPATDINNPHLLAWSQPDEPDVNNISTATLQATYNSLKKIDPNMPVYINFSGGDILYPGSGFTEADYQAMAKAGDWISNDIYPVTGYGRPDFIDLAETGPWNPGPVKWNGGVIEDTLRAWTNGKPQYAYVETSAEALPGVPNSRGPTPDEVRGETWDDIIHGARGIVYFGFGFSPWSQDATAPDVSAGITKTDAEITALGGVINSGSTSNPQRITLTNQTLEGTWRIFKGVEYYFVLNFSHSTEDDQTFSLPGVTGLKELGVYDESRNVDVSSTGTITDNFSAYQLHVYTTGDVSELPSAAAPGTSAVPEPGMGSLILLTCGFLARRPRRNRTAPTV